MSLDKVVKRYGTWTAALKALALGGLLAAAGAALARFAIANADPSNNGDSVTFTIRIRDSFPPVPVADLVGIPSGLERQVYLQWTAPIEDMGLLEPSTLAVSSYTVRYATFSISDLGGDTTAWFQAATLFTGPPPALAPGNPQSILTELDPAIRYYFGLKSTDDNGNTSDLDDNARSVSNQAYVDVKGIAGITDLIGATGVSVGEVDLAWTAPNRIGNSEPNTAYVIRVSSTGQIASDADFDAAKPLTAFTVSAPPVVGSSGTLESMNVAGLTPGVTYYFAARASDSFGFGMDGTWERNAALGLNATNFAQALYEPGDPDPVTNLSALRGTEVSALRLTWTAPANQNGVPIDRYIVKINTRTIVDTGFDPYAWFDLADSTEVVVSGRTPGTDVTVEVPGLNGALSYYVAVRSVDVTDRVSDVDDQAAGVLTQAKSRPRPIPAISNLTATTGAQIASIKLEWTEPSDANLVLPLSYEFRASTVSNIENDADFGAALPLTAFTSSSLPAHGSGGARTFTVSGLIPTVKYYFAIRHQDSNDPPDVSAWDRNPALNKNTTNFALPKLIPNDPEPVTDLTALTGSAEGELDLAWTAPRNLNFAPIDRYEVGFATFSVADLGGDTMAWFNVAYSSGLGQARDPGSLETLTLTGLEPGRLYFIAVRSIDRAEEVSPLDTQAGGAQVRARPRGIEGVTDLAARQGSSAGDIELEWTAPYRAAATLPEAYVIKVSTTANITGDAEFDAAQPLSAFSATTAPALGAGGERVIVTLSELNPAATHYFAVRVEDSAGLFGAWTVDALFNVNNSTTPFFVLSLPEAITDLTSLPGSGEGEIDLSWTAPRNQNFAAISSYTVRFATFSVTGSGGDAEAWWTATASSQRVLAQALPPGSPETLTITGLEPTLLYYFAVKSTDDAGLTSPVDTKADPGQPGQQDREFAAGIAGITDLAAQAGAQDGEIDLAWTTPRRQSETAPLSYEVRASTSGQIADNAAFEAAEPLTIFSGSPVPVVGGQDAAESLAITGLASSVTYYFAVRAVDSGAPRFEGRWVVETGVNESNFAVPEGIAPVTNLVAATHAFQDAAVSLSWTSPLRTGALTPPLRYVIKASSFTNISDDAEFEAAQDLSVFSPATSVPPVAAGGAIEGLTVIDLIPSVTYYFAIRVEDSSLPSARAGLWQRDAGRGLNAGNFAAAAFAPGPPNAITDLTALIGSLPGTIDLAWTAPRNENFVPINGYDIRLASFSVAELGGDSTAWFNAAVSTSRVAYPALEPGSLETVTVTGLVPGMVYYVGIKSIDRTGEISPIDEPADPLVPPGQAYATAYFELRDPERILDLTALQGWLVGDLELRWTAPENTNGVPIDHYLVKVNTKSVSDMPGGSPEEQLGNWFSLADSTTMAPAAEAPGAFVTLVVPGLNGALTYYAAVKSVDITGAVSAEDLQAASVINQVRSRPKPIPPIQNLVANTGDTIASVRLEWTEPQNIGLAPPLSYDIRVSSAANIENDADFDAAQPLSAFSPSTLPTPGSGGARSFVVNGLTPTVTYYFAIRELDSKTPPEVSEWRRNVGQNVNVYNSTAPLHVPNLPNAITDLTALTGGAEGEIGLAWTAPKNANFTPIVRYDVGYATFSVVDMGGDTAVWFAAASSAAVTQIRDPGSKESLILTGLASGGRFYFAVKSEDRAGEASPIDTQAGGVQVRANAKGIESVTALVAQAGSAPGDIDLTWTAPFRAGVTPPEGYVIKMSTTGNIADDAAFDAAQTLDAFSDTSIPAVGTGGVPVSLTVTGLVPFKTYYFAVRAEDSSGLIGRWLRDVGQGLNVNNSSPSQFQPNPPDPVSDLTALTGSAEGVIELAWTAPRNQNFVDIATYTVRFATFSVGELGGDTTAWFNAASSSVVVAPALEPGDLETLTVTGLEPGVLYYFAVKSTDAVSEVSPIDERAAGVVDQARARANGVIPVTDLAAQAGAASGSVDLTWTSPQRAGIVLPESYVIKASSAGNIADDADFAAAEPLSAFSRTPLPAVAAGGAAETLTVTGLAPFTTYYFAIRAEDSGAPAPKAGVWSRDVAFGFNAGNWTAPAFTPRAPEPVSDLTALTGDAAGAIELAWTAPRNLNFVPVSSYTVRFATFPVSELGGDTTAWFNAASSSVVVAPALEPGGLETLTVTGLEPGVLYYFALKSYDSISEVSAIDDKADPAKLDDQARARANGIIPVTDLVALTNGGSGAIDLTWTSPRRAGTVLPETYVIKVSTLGNIADDAAFAAAEPLSAFSGTDLPAVAAGGAAESVTITGLVPFTTHYFAVRVEDSSAPVRKAGVWTRSAALGLNVSNWALPSFQPKPPDPVTDLTAQTGSLAGMADLSWTAPRNRNYVPISSYTVRFATFSVTDLGGDTTAWFSATASSERVLSTALEPGYRETLTISGLEAGEFYYFAVKSADAIGETSPIDDGADPAKAGVQAEARAAGAARITDLAAQAAGTSGSVDLNWTAPYRAATVLPESYEIRVSTLGNIADDAAFAAARPLSAFSGTVPPVVAAGGAAESVTITGLAPFTTHYFAMRVADSSAPLANTGSWLRSAALNFNIGNDAVPGFQANLPDPITDLAAQAGPLAGMVDLTWTAPRNRNFVPVSTYTVRFATFSVADLGGDTTAWFTATASSERVQAPAREPGGVETLTVSGLEAGELYYFAVKSADAIGETSSIDDGSDPLRAGAQAGARATGVARITDLAAATNGGSGAIDLAWTAPYRAATTLPESYTVRVSTLGNIADDAGFDAALPLSALSLSPVPAVGVGGSTAAMCVTGLSTPFTTYYFAIRVEDSSAPLANAGSWLRSVALDFNIGNWALPSFVSEIPDPITGVTAQPGPLAGMVDLSWTAPRNQNFVPISSYTVRFATFSVLELGGDATAWFNLAAANERHLPTAREPGRVETLTVSGLQPGVLYYFGVKSFDAVGDVSPIDDGAEPAKAGAQAEARATGVAPVTDLRAQTNGASGAVDLTWTSPHRAGAALPERYVIKISSAANFADEAAFASALPLTALSITAAPAVGAGGAVETLTVEGLVPFTRYYFAIKVEDSSAPVANAGVWQRSVALGLNVDNSAIASFEARLPDPVTDLTAQTGAAAGEVDLSWTAPRNRNFVPISSYTVRFATFSVLELGGDTTAWFNAAAGLRVVAPAKQPGGRETLTVTGLATGELYYFAVRSYDAVSEASPIDDGADPARPGVQAGARANGVARVADLVAVTNGGAGAIDLTWTAPLRAGTVPPERYEIRMSSAGNIGDDAAFNAAQPLSAFSKSQAPSVAAGGTAEALRVTGLTPFTTYYFAIRIIDSSAPVANVGTWLRSVALNLNVNNYAAASFFPNLPEQITDLTALKGAAEGDVALQWTAPENKNLIPIARYEVRFATVSVAALGNDATAWFSLAASSQRVLSPAKAPGQLETLTVGGLNPLTTFYFAVRSIDALGETSFVDLGADPAAPRQQAFSLPRNKAPATPTGLSAVSGLVRAQLSWNALPEGLGGKGLDFSHYRLERSTDNASFVTVTTTTGVSYTDRPLKAFTTYYFRVAARDKGGNESAPSASIGVAPYAIVPQEVFGLKVSNGGGNITVRWSPTTQFADGTRFVSTKTPTADELLGYTISRTTNPRAGFTLRGAVDVGVSSFTDFTNGQAYRYRVRSFNQLGFSTATLYVTTLGQQQIVLDDEVTQVVLDAKAVAAINQETSGYDEDILIHGRRVPDDTGGKVMQAIEFIPMLGGREELKSFAFPEPVSIQVHFVTDANGQPVPQTRTYSLEQARAQRGTMRTQEANGKTSHLGMFWNNGKEYKKLYGKIDKTEQTLTVKTPNIGKFQIRSQLRDAGVTFDLSNITTRVITPNNDNKNDAVIFLFDNPAGSAVEGKVYDLRGAYVAPMTAGPQPDTLQWDGRMNGTVVTSGVYIYQIKGEGKTFNGTIVVAR
ncbi:MAG: hypothetical protein ABII00_13130 [Elusimicrobiota bacterium]